MEVLVLKSSSRRAGRVGVYDGLVCGGLSFSGAPVFLREHLQFGGGESGVASLLDHAFRELQPAVLQAALKGQTVSEDIIIIQ